jgi:hypothetical protein
MKIFRMLILAALPVFTGCVMENPCIHGEGPLVFVTMELPGMTSVDLRGSMDVVVNYGEEQKVVVKGHGNIISHLRTRVEGGNWQIGLDQGCYSDFTMTVYVTLPQLDRVSVNGSGSVTVNSWKPGEETLVLENNGSGRIDLNDLQGKESLAVFINGSGSVKCNDHESGLRKLEVYGSGSGSFFGYGAASDTCLVVSTASGNTQVFARKKLTANLSGSGNVYFKGSPLIEVSRTGSGRLLEGN